MNAGPRGLSAVPAVADRLSEINKAHVAPLSNLVRELLVEHPGDVPWFDPASGGITARVLLLLEAPGRRAAPSPAGASVKTSGFVSLDNDDQTAANLHHLVAEAGLDRELVLMWNIVPWYLSDATHGKIRAASRSDIDAGAPWLRRLVELLHDLRVAVLLGDKALRGWSRVSSQLSMPIHLLGCPHPSPQLLAPHPERRDEILRALLKAKHLAT
ncbi:MAG: uracil-DNA glycosylase [Chloroflexi bacterium]|nr:uracil-DNA glycosylase [Chloroflexota bacterium]